MEKGITLDHILNSPEARSVLESAPIGTVLIDTELNIRYFNGPQARYFGFSGDRTKPEELIGKTLFKDVPFLGRDGEETWKLLQTMLEGNHDSPSISPVEAKHNGKTKYFNMHFSRLEGGIRVDTYDITKEMMGSYIDSLTKVFNRKYFDENLMPTLNEKRGFYSVGFLYIDLGSFKELNDSKGHNAGDQMLRDVASLLQNSVVRETDYVLRIGGDEFLVVLPHVTEETVLKVVGRIKSDQGLFNSKRKELGRPQMEMDIGTSVATSNYSDAIKLAEQEMYKAKNSPR